MLRFCFALILVIPSFVFAAGIGTVTNWNYLINTGPLTGDDATAIYRHAMGMCTARRAGDTLAAHKGKLSHLTIDMYSTSKEFNERLRSGGVTPICYANFGGYENWRPDSAEWQSKLRQEGVIGDCIKKLGGGCWPGENWLRPRKSEVLSAYIRSRLQHAKAKGCVAVELDNLDGYGQGQGSQAAWVEYVRGIAAECRAQGIACGFKNASEIAPKVADDFAFITTERCKQFNECGVYEKAFRGKPRLNIEYEERPANPSSPNNMNLRRGDDGMEDALASVRRDCGQARGNAKAAGESGGTE